MLESANSTLNPSADVFVPSKISNLKDTTIAIEDSSAPFSKMKDVKNHSINEMKEIAKQLVKDYLIEKKSRGENTITKQEIIQIFEKVVLACNSNVNPKKIPIPRRLSMFPDIENLQKCKVKSFTFDLSAFKPPKPPIFLSSLYGLYRHEQAVRPLLSLTLPPSNLEDNLWSVTSKDLRLWNPLCGEPCACPPMFGYCVPFEVFGNPFNLNSKCSKKGMHFCRYPPSLDGNEHILFYTMPESSMDVELLEGFLEDEVKGESNLEFYSEQLKSIVSGVCDLISDETTKESKPALIDEIEEFDASVFWDADPSQFERKEEILEDDNCHPLLEMDYTEVNEVSGVSPEIEEMLRRCLANEPEEMKTSCCDPPCSNWCHGYSRSSSVSSSVSANISLLNDTTDFLLRNGETDSHFHKRIFKRSFSANDCDLSFEERSSREAFSRRPFLRHSLKDNDSGIVSHWSSLEEMDDMTGDGSYFEHAPMWSLFNGEDSLWKPLPDCAQQDQHSKFLPKRVRDLRRQRSLN